MAVTSIPRDGADTHARQDADAYSPPASQRTAGAVSHRDPACGRQALALEA
jgi:hypothetical protein